MYNNNTGRNNSRRNQKDEQNRRDRGKRGKDESRNYDSKPEPSPSNGNETSGIGEDRDKKSAMLYNLWQQSSNNSNSRGNSRGSDNRNNARSSERKSSKPQNILNRTPTQQDLNRVVFGTNSNFEINEIVLAPRTRGGFSYAKITKQLTKTHCFFDPLIEHKCILYRVVYHNQGKALFKDLPSPHIGKFPDSNQELQPSYEPSPDQDFSRTVGDKPSLKDLQVVVFSAQCTFATDEMVLVPRSNGGFTYGRIYKEAQQNCKLDSSHTLQAWRIIVNEDNPSNVTRKDLSVPLIGKITFTNSEIVIPKNRMALFKMCEEIPNMENAAKKESEIISDDENSPHNTSEDAEEDEEEEEDLSDEVVVYDPLAQVPSADTSASTKTVPADRPVSVQTAPTLQVGGILAIDKDDLLRKLMTPKIKPPVLEEHKHLIVLDGPNVATKHGKDQEFSTEGISIALKYWNDRGHDALAFLPEHYVRRKPGQTVTLKEFMPKVKNLPLIMDLIDKGKVVLTPPQDYDDSYVIEYAMGHNACIVTNDRYWDHIEKAASEKGQRAKKETLKWIREHLISFTFVRDEFLPNPNFKFPPQEESK